MCDFSHAPAGSYIFINYSKIKSLENSCALLWPLTLDNWFFFYVWRQFWTGCRKRKEKGAFIRLFGKKCHFFIIITLLCLYSEEKKFCLKLSKFHSDMTQNVNMLGVFALVVGEVVPMWDIDEIRKSKIKIKKISFYITNTFHLKTWKNYLAHVSFKKHAKCFY